MAEPTSQQIGIVTEARRISGTLSTGGIVNDFLPSSTPLRAGHFGSSVKLTWQGITVEAGYRLLLFDSVEHYDDEHVATDISYKEKLQVWYSVNDGTKVYTDIEEQSYPHYWLFDSSYGLYANPGHAFDKDITVNLSIECDVQKWAKYTLFQPSEDFPGAEIWEYYPPYASPHGQRPATLEYFYKPDGDFTVNIGLSCADWESSVTHSETVTSTANCFDAGLGEADYWVVSGGPDGGGELTPHTLFNGTVNGAQVEDISGIDFNTGALLSNNNSYCQMTLNSGSLAVLVERWSMDGATAHINSLCGPYTITHSGTVKHLDGATVSGAQITATVHNEGPHTSINTTTGVSGTFSLAHTYNGHYVVELLNNNDYFDPDYMWQTNEAEAHSTGWDFVSDARIACTHDDTYTTHGAGFGNAIELGEPAFNLPSPYSDTSMMHRDASGAFAWDDAVQFSIPDSQTVADWSSTVDGWALSPGGAGSLSTVGGKLRAVITAPCKLTKTISSYWAGYRTIDIPYASANSTALTLKVAGSEYSITPSNYLVDVLAPTNRSGFAYNSAWLGIGSYPWQWGINEPGTVEIDGLVAGTYDFDGITLKRLPEERAWIDVFIHPGGAFNGKVINDPRQTDPEYIQTDTLDELPVITEQGGYVVVDGCIAGEIKATRRIEYGPVTRWLIEAIPLNDANVILPAAGALSMSINPGLTSWRTSATGAVWLEWGMHSASGYESVSLGAYLYAQTSVIPPEWGSVTLDYDKRLRGQARILLTSKSGNVANKTITIKRRWGSDGPIVATSAITTDSEGRASSAALQQPTCEQWIVTSIPDSTHIVVTGIRESTRSWYNGLELWWYSDDAETMVTKTISSISGSTIALTSAMTVLEYPSAGPIWCYLPIINEIFDGTGSSLLYATGSGHLIYKPTSGHLLYRARGGDAIDIRNHSYQPVLILTS